MDARISTNVRGNSELSQRSLAGDSLVRTSVQGSVELEGVPTINDPPYDTPSDAFLAGRIAEPDLRSAKVLGQDTTTGELDLATLDVSPTGLEDIASNGSGWFPDSRLLTNTGQYQMDRIRSLNPNFEFTVYHHFAHTPSGAIFGPLTLQRPWDKWMYDNLPVLQDDTGADVAAWIDGSGNITHYWVDWWSNPNGGMNFDKQLVDDLVGEYVRQLRLWEHRPCGMMFDYFNNPNQGYYIWPSQPGDVDLNGNGTPFASDPEEHAWFQEFQNYALSAYRAAIPNAHMRGNGFASYPVYGDETLQAEGLNGWYLEGYPDVPFGSLNEYIVLDILYRVKREGLGGFTPLNGNVLAFTDLRAPYSLSGAYANQGRYTACMFDDVWHYRPHSTVSDLIESELYDTSWYALDAQVGAWVGPPQRNLSGTVMLYQRPSENGTMYIGVDSSRPKGSQITTLLFL